MRISTRGRYALRVIIDLAEHENEGSLAPVACLECGAEPCEKALDCRTLPMWDKLNGMINEYLDSVTVADLMAGL